jgi:uncharacterized membrane protein
LIDPLTIALMLFAGLLHASWHSLVKYGGDQTLILAGMGNVAAFIAMLAVPFLPFPSAPMWLAIGGSVILHVGYKLALARSYVLGDLGQAYPLGRGIVPLASTAIAFFALGQIPTFGQTVGIFVVSLGLLWLVGYSVLNNVDRRLFLAALLVGLCVAGYTVIDAYGSRLGTGWKSFTAWLIITDSLTFSALIFAAKGNQLWRDVWTYRARIVTSGILGVLSYTVFLWALSRSAVGAISALRESNVLFATVIGMAVHREQKSAHRLFAAALIVAGLATIAVMR